MEERDAERRIVGRYALFGEIAAGGMASVRFGRLMGPVGFSRTVAIKCMHAHLRSPEMASAFVDEARLAARIRHPNVATTLDVVTVDEDLYLVMEYIEGESLGGLLRAIGLEGEAVPPRIAASIIVGALHGLHAAHEATSERGKPLEIVHRDVSPQNILVGVDGVARVLDFGIAKAELQLHTTQDGQLKGKFAYMAPEQVRQEPIDRRLDIYAAGVVLWEALAGRRLFKSEDPSDILDQVMKKDIPAPSTVSGASTSASAALDAVVARAMARDVSLRYATAREMAAAIEEAIPLATQSEVGAWVQEIARDVLAERARRVAAIERTSMVDELEASSTEPSTRPPAPSLPDAATVVLPRRPDPKRKRGPIAWGAAAAAAMAVVAIAGVVGFVAVRAPRPPEVAASIAVPAVEAPIAPASNGHVTTTEAAPAANVIELPPTRRAPAARPPPRRSTAAPAKSCDPPFYVDPRGIRHPKLECL